jgi:8-oxo-dGTP diphosphatase
VRLRFFRVLSWKNEPHPREDQAIAWQRLGTGMVSPMLPANAPVLASLALPAEYAVTDATRWGASAMLERLERRLRQGLGLLQLREPGLSAEAFTTFAEEAIRLARRYGCKVMTKAPHPGADGIHFTAAELMQLSQKPDIGLVAASCHTREELERAMQLELDFAVVGPVKEKAGSIPLGWERFAGMVRGSTTPIYAIGGLTRADMEDAWRAGAHGVAMIRGAWS